MSKGGQRSRRLRRWAIHGIRVEPIKRIWRDGVTSGAFSRSAVGVALLPVPFWAMAWATGSLAISLMSGFIGVTLACRWFWSKLNFPGLLTNCLQLGAVTLVTIQSLTLLIVWFLNEFVVKDSFERFLQMQGASVASIASADFYTLCFASFLAFLGSFAWFEKQEVNLAYELRGSLTSGRGGIGVLLLAISVLELALIGTGAIGNRLIRLGDYQHYRITWYLPFLEMMFDLQVPLNALLLWRLRYPENRSFGGVFLLALSWALSFFLFFSKGRGSFLICVVLHFLFWCFFIGRRPTWFGLFCGGFVGCILIPQGFLLSNFMRSGAAGLPDWHGAVKDVTVTAVREFYSSKEFRGNEKESSLHNLASRPLVALSLAQCMALPEDRRSFMWGKDFAHSLVWTMPTVLYPSKSLFLKQEDLLNQYFLLRDSDVADSVYLSAYTDFGWLGIVTHPALLALEWAGILVLLRRLTTSIARLCVVAMWLPMWIQVIGEGALLAWLEALRDSLLIVACLAAIERILERRTEMRVWRRRSAPVVQSEPQGIVEGR